MVFLLISIILTGTDVSVNVPDSVQVGTAFSCEISVRGENLSSLDCTPLFSDGLVYMGSSSMHSFSTISTSTGTSISSEIHLSMSFNTSASGIYTIGPLSLTSSGRELFKIPVMTVTAHGDIPVTVSAGSPQEECRQDNIGWIEIEIDTTGRVYPGQTINIDYYICKTRHNAEIVDLYLEPSDYASSNLVEDTEELQWARCKNGVYRTWLATLEITPAFACTLSLPILRGRIGVPGGMMRPPSEYYISTEGESIPVYAFPKEDRPENFQGITSEVFFNIERVIRGYSAAGEKCIQLSISGPGYSQMNEYPELTIQGPAELHPGRRFSLTDDTNAWHILVEPSDSGTVIIGPDSVSWFDTNMEEYRQAIIPACTLFLFPAQIRPVDISVLLDNDDVSSFIWILIISILLLITILITLRYRNIIIGSAPEILETKDVEELLTAMGYKLSEMLTSSRSCMGFQELDEALDEKSIDVIVSRGLLRHWKDLELMLSGRTVSTENLEMLKKKSIDLVSELQTELNKEQSV